MAAIDNLFHKLMEMGGSDLHLAEGEPPKVRAHGHLEPVEGHEVLTRDRISAYLKEITPERQWKKFTQSGDADYAYGMGDEARFRANLYKQLHGYGGIFRIIPSEVLTLQDLKAPDILRELSEISSGLVLVTGPTGSGKSTTLAAMINHINQHVARHIVTIEEPVEFMHKNIKSMVTQREVGEDTESFASALRSVTRQDVDVVLVGEMRDYETISLALSAAAMGMLVFGTLHTNSAAKTIDRIVSVFPAKQQNQARSMLSQNLQGVCSQALVRTRDGKGRVAVHEILRSTSALPKIITDGQIFKVRNLIQSSGRAGMILLDDALENYRQQGVISAEDAYQFAQEKDRFAQFLNN
jgi:twitching motility protein PilT